MWHAFKSEVPTEFDKKKPAKHCSLGINSANDRIILKCLEEL